METSNFLHNQQNVPIPFKKESRHGKHKDPNYSKNYYLNNKEQIKERARIWSKEHYIPHPKKVNPKYNEERITKFLKTVNNKEVVLDLIGRGKFPGRNGKGIKCKEDVFSIRKKDKNYMIRAGIENSYRDYQFAGIDVDGRKTSHIGTENNSLYFKSPSGNHFRALFKKKVLNRNLVLWIPIGNKEVRVDFKVNGYVLGVGSGRPLSDGTIGKYEMKGRGWNCDIKICETDLELAVGFIEKYNARFEFPSQQRLIERLSQQFNIQAQIEQMPLQWDYYKNIWLKK